ncbi:LysR family transcriptional regulator [Bdellovibrionota bacterium FG-1]
MNLEQLRYFAALAQLEHVGKAAKASAISPSALSTAVSHLEAELGHPLFDRIGRSIRLNENGKRLLPEIQEILAKIATLPQLEGQSRQTFQGKARIGASPFLASHVVAPAWLKIAQKNPRATADLEAPESSLAIARVLRGDLDAALVFSPQNHPDLVITEVSTGKLLIAGRSGHPILRESKSSRVKKLSQYPATFHHGAAGIELCRDHSSLLQLGISTHILATFENDEQALALLTQSDAWAVLPDIVIQASKGKLVPLLNLNDETAKYRICWITRTRDLSVRPWFEVIQHHAKTILSKRF